MSQADVLLQEGVAAAKAGNKELARRLLREVTELDPGNELAWLWLAGVSDSAQEVAAYLRQVLEINPANERALSGLKWALAQTARSEPVHWECALCRTKFPEQLDKCPACGAISTLTDLDALLSNDDVDRKQVRQAIDRYESASGDDFMAHYNLGLAHLNLKRIDEGTAHLQAALRLQPADKVLQAQVESLLQRQAAAEARAREKDIKEQAALGTILVVDDSPTVHKLVTITLERHGYQVMAAADGLEALAKMNEGLPDLILLDITMPRMDGYQLCKIIKGNQDTRHIPVVMLSGKDGFFDKVRGRMVGSTDYITKPFEPGMLLQVVEKRLRK